MISHRNLPVVCSLLLVAAPAAVSRAQAPLLPPSALSGNLLAQANTPAPSPIAPPAAATTPGVEATPAPLDPNAGPAPIAPPPVITGQPGAPAAGAAAVDTTAPAGPAVNAAGPRAREFQGDDVGQVLRLLARQAKINVIVSDAIVGTINMRLEDVTAMQAIEVICQSKGYDLTQNNGVYYVKTAAERAAEPTQGDSYTFSYARATQVIPLLTSQLKAKGIVPQVDERTNTVYYQEAKSNVAAVHQFLIQVDRPTKQVMIEARLVEVNSNPRQSYGINWGGVFGSSSSGKTFSYGGSPLGTTTVDPATGLPTTTLPTNPAFSAGTAQNNDFLLGNPNRPGFDFNGIKSALGGQFAILSVPQFSATLRFLNEDTDAEFLANPRVVTADNLKATIKITRKQPVPQLNFNEQTASAVFSGFEFKEFGNTLEVTPSINKDNFITMSVKPEISNKVQDANFQFQGATVSSPVIDTRTLDSNVLIKSGCTLAIGGLLQDETSQGLTKVPVLGDIPIVGYLFQEHINSRTKRNLLIFVTPTIITQQYGTGLEDQVTGLKHSGRNEMADNSGWRNNAKGSLRLVKTQVKPIASEYPAPGDCNPPGVNFKETANTHGD